jgi:hypothetical protein
MDFLKVAGLRRGNKGWYQHDIADALGVRQFVTLSSEQLCNPMTSAWD